MDGLATVHDEVVYAERCLQRSLDLREYKRRLGYPRSDLLADHIAAEGQKLAEARACERQLFRVLHDPSLRLEHLAMLGPPIYVLGLVAALTALGLLTRTTAGSARS
jgi:hypothetical protein